MFYKNIDGTDAYMDSLLCAVGSLGEVLGAGSKECLWVQTVDDLEPAQQSGWCWVVNPEGDSVLWHNTEPVADIRFSARGWWQAEATFGDSGRKPMTCRGSNTDMHHDAWVEVK